MDHMISSVTQLPKGSLENNVTFWTPLHPVWPRCENSEYPDIPAFSRLARRAFQRPKLRTYFFVDLKLRKRTRVYESF
jgi:hypothetical protein